jgi:hypothetical protein
MKKFDRFKDTIGAGNCVDIHICVRKPSTCISTESKPVHMPTWRLLLNMARADKRRMDAKDPNEDRLCDECSEK